MVHPFIYTLGDGPYKYMGARKGGGTCSHCSSALQFLCFVRNGAGDVLMVGSTCVEKVGLPYEIVSAAKKARLAHQRALASERRARKRREKHAALEALAGEHQATLAALPHPSEGLAAQGRTLADYIAYCLQFCSIDNAYTLAKKAVGEA